MILYGQVPVPAWLVKDMQRMDHPGNSLKRTNHTSRATTGGLPLQNRVRLANRATMGELPCRFDPTHL